MNILNGQIKEWLTNWVILEQNKFTDCWNWKAEHDVKMSNGWEVDAETKIGQDNGSVEEKLMQNIWLLK